MEIKRAEDTSQFKGNNYLDLKLGVYVIIYFILSFNLVFKYTSLQSHESPPLFNLNFKCLHLGHFQCWCDTDPTPGAYAGPSRSLCCPAWWFMRAVGPLPG